MIVVVEQAGSTPCFLSVLFLGLKSCVQTELLRVHVVLEFQLSAFKRRGSGHDSGDAACQPVALEELWLQMNKRGMRDADRRI